MVEDFTIKMFPNNFFVIFDGWPDSIIHFFAIFVNYLLNGEYMGTILACAPILQKGYLSSLQYKLLLEETLQVY